MDKTSYIMGINYQELSEKVSPAYVIISVKKKKKAQSAGNGKRYKASWGIYNL